MTVGCILPADRCEACSIGFHPEQRSVHPWASPEDLAHALAQGHPDPSDRTCKCWCSRPPQRIQRRRTRGWRMPEGAIYVGRPTRWGNPFQPGKQCILWHQDCSQDAKPGDMHRDSFTVVGRDHAVRLFRACLDPADHRWTDMDPGVPALDDVRRALAGRDLVCWCREGDPCHADVLLELANGGA